MSYHDLPTQAQVRDADEMWGVDGFEMTELFSNEVPHVKGERVLKPSGMPPAEWALADDVGAAFSWR
jgi:hypothetical protein